MHGARIRYFVCWSSYKMECVGYIHLVDSHTKAIEIAVTNATGHA